MANRDMDQWFDDPAYIAYCEDLDRRHDEGRDYPISDPLPCWDCGRGDPAHAERDEFGNLFINRICVALGPIAEPHRDPTQSYLLECGHIVI